MNTDKIYAELHCKRICTEGYIEGGRTSETRCKSKIPATIFTTHLGLSQH